MADAVGLWVIVYFCVTSVNTKDCIMYCVFCVNNKGQGEIVKKNLAHNRESYPSESSP